MRILCIDYGDRNIGIAVSDPLGWTANGLETIKWYGRIEKPLERISQILKEYNPEKVVVGFPVNMNGTEGPKVEATLEFIRLLSELTNAEIFRSNTVTY